ncbi:MAG: NADH-quinone oxidoreductase subunit NuoG [Defluviicoccus sp.]|nr:NADH-quinone oxidoreductase subunit NuoG [Defluviicoccus sp.]
MATLTIDGVEIEVEDGITVLQACEEAGIEIPRFCYHERLSIAGNCRMCLVEMERSPKPIASCAMPVGNNMVIRTNTPMVRKARQGVMEFLLINHPLDCPICDQGGECDLQDQAMAYGFDRSRFAENKRAVPDKDFGPLVETHMTRCIHCTRCIRFATEIAGVEELGATGRGEHMEVGTYVEKALTSELSGNIIDLCPVGALTSKPYAFNARPWELAKTETVDVMDAVGSNIRVDSRDGEVQRVVPLLNEDINEEWISDKTRFACDGLRRQRLDTPYVRSDGRLAPASWAEALCAVAERLDGTAPQRMAAIAGDLACCESMAMLKDLFAALGSPHVDARQEGAKLSTAARAGYLFNTAIVGIEDADACLVVGADVRREAPLVNARLRKRQSMGGFPVGLIGEPVDLTWRYDHLGNDAASLSDIAAGGHPFCAVLEAAARPMIVLGEAAYARHDGARILGTARAIAERFGMASEDWNGFNVLHRAAARVGGLDLGLVPGEGGRDVEAILAGAESGEIEAVYLLGADEIDTQRLGEAFVIYQGHHGDAGAMRADVILPGAAYTEKEATYVNLEGRPQRTARAVHPPGEAREDWRILRALSETLGRKLPCDTVEQVRARMAAIAPVLAGIGAVERAPWQAFGEDGTPDPGPLGTVIGNYYMTDPISRSSETMAACTRAFLGSARAAVHG